MTGLPLSPGVRKQKRITDAINGYRAITRSTWKDLNPDADGYTIEYQISIRAYKFRKTVVEFPTVEANRIGGGSEASSIKTGLQMLKLYLKEL